MFCHIVLFAQHLLFECPLCRGVPQGFVLGHIFFTLKYTEFIMSLKKKTINHINLFHAYFYYNIESQHIGALVPSLGWNRKLEEMENILGDILGSSNLLGRMQKSKNQKHD